MYIQKSLLYILLLLVLLMLNCSTSVQTLKVDTRLAYLDTLSLQAIALSEDMSSLSTQEDEIHLFAFQIREGQVLQSYQSPLCLFNAKDSVHLVALNFKQIEKEDELSFFLIELDNEQLNDQLFPYCQQLVINNTYATTLDMDTVHRAFGHDDLLGLRRLKASEANIPFAITFKGLQLFDRFEYRLCE